MNAPFRPMLALLSCFLCVAPMAAAGVLDPKHIGTQDWDISIELRQDGGSRSPFFLVLTSDGTLHNTAVIDSTPWRLSREHADKVLVAVCEYLDGLRIATPNQALKPNHHRQIMVRLAAGEFSVSYTTPHIASPEALPAPLRAVLDLLLSADPKLKSYFNQQLSEQSGP